MGETRCSGFGSQAPGLNLDPLSRKPLSLTVLSKELVSETAFF